MNEKCIIINKSITINDLFEVLVSFIVLGILIYHKVYLLCLAAFLVAVSYVCKLVDKSKKPLIVFQRDCFILRDNHYMLRLNNNNIKHINIYEKWILIELDNNQSVKISCKINIREKDVMQLKELNIIIRFKPKAPTN